MSSRFKARLSNLIITDDSVSNCSLGAGASRVKRAIQIYTVFKAESDKTNMYSLAGMTFLKDGSEYSSIFSVLKNESSSF